MRGLKQSLQKSNIYDHRVASFTDAWIETAVSTSNFDDLFVASFTDAWIETFSLNLVFIPENGRIFYRCVD